MTGKKRHLPRVLCLLFLFCIGIMLLTGCSMKPTYYSKSYVKKYVKKSFDQPELIEELSYPDNTSEENPVYEYRFRDEHGDEFSVFCETSHVRFNVSTTIFYERNIRNNYIETKLALRKAEIDEILGELSFQTEYSPYGIVFYMAKEQDIRTASDAIAKIDKLLDLHYRDEEMELCAELRFKPAGAGEDWVDESVEYVGEIQFSDGQGDRLRWRDVKTDIEQQVTDYSKRYDIDLGLSEELMEAYDAPELQVFVGDRKMEDYYFWRNDDIYSISSLDPCQDFEDFPYEYKGKGRFAALVRAAGGEYYCDDWEAKWVIGKDEWKAKLKVNKDHDFKAFYVWKNGKKLSLSDPNGETNSTSAGRTFTIEDLSLLLGKDYVIDQKNMSVTFR